MKHLPKHLQPRWRYLAVRIESWPETTISRDSFQRALWYSAQNLLGDRGSARLDLSVLRFRYSDGDGEAIVRTRRGQQRPARASLACLDEIDEQPLGLRVVGCSGTVRACEEKYMGRARETPEEQPVVFENAERSAFISGQRVDVQTTDAFIGATTTNCN